MHIRRGETVHDLGHPVDMSEALFLCMIEVQEAAIAT